MSNRIKQLRNERGLRQWQLAELVNSTPQQISHLERGERQLTLQWMSRLSAALGCQPADLLPEMLPGEPVGTEDLREAALLKLFRALSTAEQDVFLKIGNAMAQSNTILTGLLRSSR